MQKYLLRKEEDGMPRIKTYQLEETCVSRQSTAYTSHSKNTCDPCMPISHVRYTCLFGRARVNHNSAIKELVLYYYTLRKPWCTLGALAAAEPQRITGNMRTQDAPLEVSGRALPPLLHGMITPYHHDLSYNMG